MQNLDAIILDDTGFQPMRDLPACGVIMNPTPSEWGAFAPSWPEKRTVCPVDSCISPDSSHLVWQRPKIDRLYAVISAAIYAHMPASYIVLTFHVPSSVVALGVSRGVGITASFRLSL